MNVTFLMPCYAWGPSGGFRVIYEYANRLVERGHQVSVVHPRRLKHPPSEALTARAWGRKHIRLVREYVSTPDLSWQYIDPRVNLRFVPTSDARYAPAGDVVFATAWHTVPSVMEYSKAYGEKCYLIQGYETWQAPQDVVDGTWQLPLHKIIVAKWLGEIADRLKCTDVTYIPNAIDQNKYRLTAPIETRAQQVSMMFSTTKNKGANDGIAALSRAKERHPNMHATLFGVSPRPSSLPEWIEYFENPDQNFLIQSIYNTASIFLSASWSEGFGLPAAEAAACGCAIVSTDSGGVRELVEEGVTGLMSRPKRPDELAANLCTVLQDDNLRISLARAANQSAKRLNWKTSADLMESFLSRVTSHAFN
jgi:L-malate glycosyltransferase